MFQISAILVVIYIPCVDAEDYLEHFSWLKSIVNDAKLWFNYVTRFQTEIIHQTEVIPNNNHLQTALHCASESAKKFHFQSKVVHQFGTGNHCLLSEIQQMLLPFSQIEFTSQIHKICSAESGSFNEYGYKLLNYVRGLGGFFDLKYAFDFTIHTQLRINLSFINIYIPNMLESCYTNYLEIHQVKRKTGFVYCGIHADFNLYSLHNHVNVTANLREAYPLVFSFIASAFSKQLVFNEMSNPKPKLYPMVVHHIMFCHAVLSTYRVTTQKFMTLILNISKTIRTSIFLYDGPGIKSDRVEPLISPNRVSLGTYQCLLQFRESSSTFSMQNIKYKGKVFFNKVVLANISMSMSIHYPPQVCVGLYCVVYLHSPQNSILNISLWNVVFTGPQNGDCNFGGISIMNLFEEIFEFCENGVYRTIVDSHWHRVVYTEYSSGVLLLHSYKEYSSFNCHLNISAANCELIKLATCGDYQLKVVGMERVLGTYFTFVQSLDPKKCTVVQVSSGLHDKNKMLTIEMNDAYMGYTNGFIYPICKAVELKLDQTKYKKFAAYFQVKSIIQKLDTTSHISFEKENRAFQGEISYSEVCPGRGKMLGNSSLAKTSAFGFHFEQMSVKAKCHVELSALYHIKTTMTVYKINFPYLTGNWVVFVVNTSNVNFERGSGTVWQF